MQVERSLPQVCLLGHTAVRKSSRGTSAEHAGHGSLSLKASGEVAENLFSKADINAFASD